MTTFEKAAAVVSAAVEYVTEEPGSPDTQGLYRRLELAIQRMQASDDCWDEFANHMHPRCCQHRKTRPGKTQWGKDITVCTHCGKSFGKEEHP